MNMKTFRLPSRHQLTFIAVALAVAIAVLPAAARAETNGVLTGSVMNETTGQPVSGIEVSLTGFTSDGIFDERSSTTDETGQFTFSQVDTDEGIVYAASVSYRGVLYSSGMIRFLESTEQSSSISVFETTTDRSVVGVNSRGIVLSELDPQSGDATILDIVSLTVDGNQTFIAGDTGRSLEFPIPRNASAPTLLPGFDFGTAVVENSVVYASSPLRPDGGSASLNYTVQYTGSRFAIDVRNAYPTSTFRILIPTDLTGDSDSITVGAAGFEDEGTAEIGGREYHVWGTTDLAQNSSVRIIFGDLPKSAFQPNRLRVMEPAILAGVFLIGATAATALIVRRRQFTQAEPEIEQAITAGFVESREELVLQLQKLQDEHDNGMIDDEHFLAERRILLERLRIVTRHLRDTPVSEPEE
jgi:hypothetical protein